MGVLQDLDAAGLGHADVGDYHVIERGVDLGLGGLSRVHGFDAVAFAAQSDVEEFANGALVVGYKNVTHEHLLLLNQYRQNRQRRNGRPGPPQSSPRLRSRQLSLLCSTGRWLPRATAAGGSRSLRLRRVQP